VEGKEKRSGSMRGMKSQMFLREKRKGRLGCDSRRKEKLLWSPERVGEGGGYQHLKKERTGEGRDQGKYTSRVVRGGGGKHKQSIPLTHLRGKRTSSNSMFEIKEKKENLRMLMRKKGRRRKGENQKLSQRKEGNIFYVRKAPRRMALHSYGSYQREGGRYLLPEEERAGVDQKAREERKLCLPPIRLPREGEKRSSHARKGEGGRGYKSR